MKGYRFAQSGNRGQALLELAVILPLIVLLAAAVFDFSRMIHAKNIITNMSREGAGLASRSSLAKQEIMNSLAYTSQPLRIQNNGNICVTVAKGVAGMNPIIDSQECWANGVASIKSRIGTPLNASDHPAAQNLGALVLADGQTAYVVEVFYNYRSLLISKFMNFPSQIYSMAIF